MSLGSFTSRVSTVLKRRQAGLASATGLTSRRRRSFQLLTYQYSISSSSSRERSYCGFSCSPTSQYLSSPSTFHPLRISNAHKPFWPASPFSTTSYSVPGGQPVPISSCNSRFRPWTWSKDGPWGPGRRRGGSGAQRDCAHRALSRSAEDRRGLRTSFRVATRSSGCPG